MGALFGHFGEKGIDKAFQQQVRDYLKPGTSALFMVIEQATPDKAVAALQQYGGTVIRTSLSDEDTKRLQEAIQPPGAGRLTASASTPESKEIHMPVVGAATHQTLSDLSAGKTDFSSGQWGCVKPTARPAASIRARSRWSRSPL